jgi:SET domain
MNAVERLEQFPALLERAEKEVLSLPQIDCDIVHTFAPGIYMREMRVPADSFIMGHAHKTEHLNLLMRGRMRMFTEHGHNDLSAPALCIGSPGRKVAYAFEESVWINLHATNERDIEKLDEMLLEKSSYWESLQAKEPRLEDIEDFNRVITTTGLSAEKIRELSETQDLIPFPYGSYKVKVNDSAIEGKGLFSTARIKKDELICMGRIGDRRTPAGRYINHGKYPNARMQIVKDRDIGVFANRDIKGSSGGYEGEEIIVDYIQGLAVNLRSMQ